MPRTTKIVSFLHKLSKGATKPTTQAATKVQPKEVQAYIVEQETSLKPPPKLTDEQIQIKKIEAHPELKDAIITDPMPPFTTVEQRLIDLADRKLHPFYKLYMTIPPRKNQFKTILPAPANEKEKRSEEEIFKEINQRLKLENKDGEEKPTQLIKKLTEIERNRKDTLCKDSCKPKK